HELRTGARTEALRLPDLGSQLLSGAILDSELHEAHARGQQAAYPRCAVDDGIDTRQAHPRNALPITGVEGTARSRGSIGPATYAALPASTACANAPAMPTGSRAWETAVLMRTASNPSSNACAACEGTPIPASTTRGTSGKRARRAVRPNRLFSPRCWVTRARRDRGRSTRIPGPRARRPTPAAATR